jgi:hypothetical protein
MVAGRDGSDGCLPVCRWLPDDYHPLPGVGAWAVGPPGRRRTRHRTSPHEGNAARCRGRDRAPQLARSDSRPRVVRACDVIRAVLGGARPSSRSEKAKNADPCTTKIPLSPIVRPWMLRRPKSVAVRTPSPETFAVFKATWMPRRSTGLPRRAPGACRHGRSRTRRGGDWPCQRGQGTRTRGASLHRVALLAQSAGSKHARILPREAQQSIRSAHVSTGLARVTTICH